jgi:hypothetical protein
MSEHTHTKAEERGPYGCKGNVAFIETCQCGAERRTCACDQCENQGTNIGRWEMPGCTYCNRRHPVDQSCQPTGYTSDF